MAFKHSETQEIGSEGGSCIRSTGAVPNLKEPLNSTATVVERESDSDSKNPMDLGPHPHPNSSVPSFYKDL